MSLTALVPLPLVERLLGEALSHGADFAEVYVERSARHNVSLEERKIRSAQYDVALGVGIRAIAGQRVGYAYSDDLSTDKLLETARVAGQIASAGGKSTPVKVSQVATADLYPVAVAPEAVAVREKILLLERGENTARAFDPRVLQVMGAFTDETKDILVANSRGHYATDRQILCRMHFRVVADDHGDRRTGFHGGGGRVGLERFVDFSPESVAGEAARMAVAQLGALDAPTGPQTVVLGPGWSGVLLHEAIGHGLEADFIRKGTSLYAGKVGQQVASSLCTVIDNGTLPHARGSLNVDDEGGAPQEKVLIENGILRGYMVDQLNGQIMGIPSTGSGRRESFAHLPMPRMTNTYLAPGPHDPEEILRSVPRGLYCKAFGGGQVDISNGNFVFEVVEAYLIEDGRLGRPVKNATLIGIGPEALKKVDMVGNDAEHDPGIGTCGKNGQSVPVGVGLPTLRIQEVTVGGTALRAKGMS